MTLIETLIALGILLVISAGIMSVALVSTTTTENQGNLGARTAEYAQDKMEQLISLSYCDGDNVAPCAAASPTPSGTDTTTFPSTCCAGYGLLVGGSADPAAPVTGYVDYLDSTGTPLPLGAGGAAPAGWYYIRVWQISKPAGTTNLKQITVTCKVAYGVGSSGIGALSQSTLSTQKAYLF